MPLDGAFPPYPIPFLPACQFKFTVKFTVISISFPTSFNLTASFDAAAPGASCIPSTYFLTMKFPRTRESIPLLAKVL